MPTLWRQTPQQPGWTALEPVQEYCWRCLLECFRRCRHCLAQAVPPPAVRPLAAGRGKPPEQPPEPEMG